MGLAANVHRAARAISASVSRWTIRRIAFRILIAQPAQFANKVNVYLTLTIVLIVLNARMVKSAI